jgi:sugar lactone lactonase YvrE
MFYAYLYNVYCIQKDGSDVFTFSSPDHSRVCGIDTDRQGNVYVVGFGSNNILRLSPDGQNSDIIMKKEDGIIRPITLCFRPYTPLRSGELKVNTSDPSFFIQ